MSYKQSVLGQSGLQFFGKMTASISHELRNVFAVLNENAGLMEDLLLMSEKGTPMDPERLKSLARSMGKQIQRGDGIVDNMNRFAHEVDQPIRPVDLKETIGFWVALSARLADMRGVKIDPVGGEKIIITTNPFFLENLLWCVVDFAMETVGKEKTVTVTSERGETGIRIRFSGLENLEQTGRDEFPSEKEQALLESLKADLSFNSDSEEIVITLPEKIHAVYGGPQMRE